MAMPTIEITNLVTFEQAAQLDPDICPGEIDEGRWIPMSKNTWRHAEIAGNVFELLKRYCRSHKEWSAAVGDPGTKLQRSPDTLRGPDVAVARRERVPKGSGADGWLEGAPELAVEVTGDSQSPGELALKATEYLQAGAHQVWVVDEKARLVIVYSQPNQIRIVGAENDEEILDGGDLLPGFSCRIADLFE